jgi:hypothetical protein
VDYTEDARVTEDAGVWNEGESFSSLYVGALFVYCWGGFYEECMKLLMGCLCIDGIGAEQSSNDDGA